MKRVLCKFIAWEEGSSAIIVVLTMSFLMLFAALSVDFGLAYYRIAQAQNAADAAALAAGSLLPVDKDDPQAILKVKDAAIFYASENGAFDITEDDVVLSGGESAEYTRVNVNIPFEIQMNFAKMFGMSSQNVVRGAKAEVAPCDSITGAAPLGVDYLQLKTLLDSGETQHIYLKYGGGDGDTGSYGAIDLDGVKGGGASDFETWLTYGYAGVIEVGENLLPVEKGNMAGATFDSMQVRFNACTHFTDDGGCTSEHFDPNCPRLIKVLVTEKVGTSYVKVKGFAAFIIEGVYEDVILGSYVNYFEEGSVDTVPDWGSIDYGMYNLGLVG